MEEMGRNKSWDNPNMKHLVNLVVFETITSDPGTDKLDQDPVE